MVPGRSQKRTSTYSTFPSLASLKISSGVFSDTNAPLLGTPWADGEPQPDDIGVRDQARRTPVHARHDGAVTLEAPAALLPTHASRLTSLTALRPPRRTADFAGVTTFHMGSSGARFFYASTI